MSNITVLCDVDGVVADLHKEWLRRYNEDYNDTLTMDMITDWEITKFVKPECGSKIFDYWKDQTFYAWVDPIPGAVNGVEVLRSRGHRVVFVTSCADGTVDQKVNWLRAQKLITNKYGPGPDFVAASDKGLIRGDVLIDDHLRNLEAAPELDTILFDQPWNAHADSERHDWEGILAYISRVYG